MTAKSVTVQRQGKWLVISSSELTRCYPVGTDADDLELWAQAQDKRIDDAIKLRDLLRAASKEIE